MIPPEYFYVIPTGDVTRIFEFKFYCKQCSEAHTFQALTFDDAERIWNKLRVEGASVEPTIHSYLVATDLCRLKPEDVKETIAKLLEHR